ncbi:MAG: glycosyltransferase family 39 protein [Anaerolineales bacterium]|nr:glycosyltransferase family 39 protein [Chloroflexota bacterium]MBL6980928.1 glycosyltransferase family 39 protein [Anaerolineales bacterium]
MSRYDRIALFLSILAFIITAWISTNIFQGLPHLEDEYAYVWQAQAIAGGKFILSSPPESDQFFVPFVIDHNGQRFGKYPLGWPVVLSIGERLGLRWMVNPLLAGLAVWLTYRLGKKILGELCGLFAAGLTLTSPIFLMRSGMLLSHPWGLVLSAAFALTWLEVVDQQNDTRRWLPSLGAGFALGVFALSRPLTALGVALPFAIHGLILLWRGSPTIRRRVLTVGIVALVVGSLHFLWQHSLTGNPLRNPYTLWWEYDKIGFGPGHGVLEGGHTLKQALINTKLSLAEMAGDLFGWGIFSWIFLPFGLWAVRKQKKSWLIGGVPLGLIIVYLPYWISGARYLYEGLYGFTLISAAGIAWLAGWGNQSEGSKSKFGKIRSLGMVAILVLLIAVNLIGYTPQRLMREHQFYEVDSSALQPFRDSSVQELAPAIILVHSENWRDYALLLDLADPFLETPFIFAWSPMDDYPAKKLAEAFPERTLYHYYPEEPGQFYQSPREN